MLEALGVRVAHIRERQKGGSCTSCTGTVGGGTAATTAAGISPGKKMRNFEVTWLRQTGQEGKSATRQHALSAYSAEELWHRTHDIATRDREESAKASCLKLLEPRAVVAKSKCCSCGRMFCARAKRFEERVMCTVGKALDQRSHT